MVVDGRFDSLDTELLRRWDKYLNGYPKRFSTNTLKAALNTCAGTVLRGASGKELHAEIAKRIAAKLKELEDEPDPQATRHVPESTQEHDN